MTSAPSWGRIPSELRERAQWLLASPDAKGALKVPTSVNAAGNLYPGSSTDRATWLPFDVAAGAALHFGLAIGYVCDKSDPFACIDLDVKNRHNEADEKKWTPQADLDAYWAIVQQFDSYTEISQSGYGLHIWVHGKTVDGARHRGVEVYSFGRFLVCTGNVLVDKPIGGRQALLDRLVLEIRMRQGASRKAVELDTKPEVLTDEEIWARARSADNFEKFLKLCNGEWQTGEYPSQSEADLALLSMFTFYSRNDEQCRRMFRQTKLGARDKAQKDDRYLDYTLKLIRGRQEHEDMQQLKFNAQASALVERMQQEALAARAAQAQQLPAPLEQSAASALPEAAAPGIAAAGNAPQGLPPAPAQSDDQSIPWPPGLVGALAGFIYRSAPRPVKEVAIVAALGLMAGICGKMWNIPGSGLNMYLILVARSAIGKEAMHSGLSLLLARLRQNIPSATEFVDFSDFASGPALIKACAGNQCFVNVAGEWGRKLKKIAEDSQRDGPMQTLRTAMTNLYQKSGPTALVGGLTYSKKEENVASVTGVAYSMIGETTPGTFYEALTESMMEDGFLSRFTVIEYTGERPPANPNPQTIPEPALVEAMSSLILQAKTMMHNRVMPIGIMRTHEAGAIMDAFDKECDNHINGTQDESKRQMWNRAHLKMLRIAALLAVGDNYLQPVIDVQHLQWAQDVVRRDIGIMGRKIESGEIGSGDNAREKRMAAIIREYITHAPGSGYNIPKGMREQGFISRSYIQIRTARLTVFTSHKLGATRALDDTLRSFIDSGYLMELARDKAVEMFNSTGKVYRIMDLPGAN